MRVISDLHIHSHYSRATSQNMNIMELSRFAKIKGLDLLGTGDFSHPKWFSELKEHLTEKSPGIYGYGGMNFLLSNEISLIYTQGGRGRRVHNVILAPNFDVVEEINRWLKTKGRLDYDGRPIFGFSCIELVEALKGIDRNIEIIPSHVWTPWFSLFGSKSGFDSVQECFQDQAKHIFALETGLSSDPAMNWRLSALDKYALVSFSDSHSPWPWRIGREATVFELKELAYRNVIEAIRTKKGFTETIEFFPEEGKYHLDGHRNCNICLEPAESLKYHNMCPKCGRPLTVGVLQRVHELADRPEGFVPKGAIPFKSLIPLSEIIAAGLGTKVLASQHVWVVHNSLINAFGDELKVLLEAPKDELERVAGEKTARYIIAVREGRVKIKPGYDGVYGEPVFEGDIKKQETSGPDFSGKKQKNLLDFKRQ